MPSIIKKGPWEEAEAFKEMTQRKTPRKIDTKDSPKEDEYYSERHPYWKNSLSQNTRVFVYEVIKNDVDKMFELFFQAPPDKNHPTGFWTRPCLIMQEMIVEWSFPRSWFHQVCVFHKPEEEFENEFPELAHVQSCLNYTTSPLWGDTHIINMSTIILDGEDQEPDWKIVHESKLRDTCNGRERNMHPTVKRFRTTTAAPSWWPPDVPDPFNFWDVIDPEQDPNGTPLQSIIDPYVPLWFRPWPKDSPLWKNIDPPKDNHTWPVWKHQAHRIFADQSYLSPSTQMSIPTRGPNFGPNYIPQQALPPNEPTVPESTAMLNWDPSGPLGDMSHEILAGPYMALSYVRVSFIPGLIALMGLILGMFISLWVMRLHKFLQKSFFQNSLLGSQDFVDRARGWSMISDDDGQRSPFPSTGTYCPSPLMDIR